jgi:hypothetical protein
MKVIRLAFVTGVLVLAALAIPVQLAAQQHHHYKLIDMGTLGGPASSINFPLFQGTLNNRSMTVSWSATSVPALPASSFLICGGLDAVVPFITHSFEWNGAFKDLGALPPSATNCSEPFYMNSKGEVVGASETADIDPQFFGIDLGTLRGNQVAAFGINNRGQIMGSSTYRCLATGCSPKEMPAPERFRRSRMGPESCLSSASAQTYQRLTAASRF